MSVLSVSTTGAHHDRRRSSRDSFEVIVHRDGHNFLKLHGRASRGTTRVVVITASCGHRGERLPFLQESRPPVPPQRTPKYASSGRVRVRHAALDSRPLRNHLEVFGKGVQGQSRVPRGCKRVFPLAVRFMKVISSPTSGVDAITHYALQYVGAGADGLSRSGHPAQIRGYTERPAGEHQKLSDILIHPEVCSNNRAPGYEDEIVSAKHEIGSRSHLGEVRGAGHEFAVRPLGHHQYGSGLGCRPCSSGQRDSLLN
jgi:hypothetical protein